MEAEHEWETDTLHDERIQWLILSIEVSMSSRAVAGSMLSLHSFALGVYQGSALGMGLNYECGARA